MLDAPSIFAELRSACCIFAELCSACCIFAELRSACYKLSAAARGAVVE